MSGMRRHAMMDEVNFSRINAFKQSIAKIDFHRFLVFTVHFTRCQLGINLGTLTVFFVTPP